MPSIRPRGFPAIALAFVLALLVPASAGAAAKHKLHVSAPNSARCEFIGAPGGRCLLPFPSDYYTVADKKTATGRRVSVNRLSMPANTKGVHIDPAQWNRNDGFSPGQAIVVKIPGLDTPAAFKRSGIVPVTDMGQYSRPGAPVVLIDAVTHKRALIWAELDATAGTKANTALIIREGKNLVEGHRYVVALRGLKTAAGATIKPPTIFRAYRDKLATDSKAVEARRPKMERIFSDLAKAKIGRKDLYLAWDFTVASQRNLSERMLSMRNTAFAQLGDTNLADRKIAGRAPAYTVDPTDATYSDEGKSWTYVPCGADGCQPGESDKVARRVTGTFSVPCYLNQTGCPAGAGLHFATGSNIPTVLPGNVYTARYVCKIPRASLDGPARTGNRAAVYGHGLLGDPNTEINQDQIDSMVFDHGFVYCATRWIGLADEDISNAAKILQDLSTFNTIPDRTQEGFLAQMFLERLMVHPQGFRANPAFADNGGQSDFDTGDRAYYDGNSQGGIFGGALLALSPDVDHGVLGVTGMNFSTLLQRSVDFNSYAQILYKAYPDTLNRQVILSMLQMLWDRGEADGYAEHMTTSPYANTPPHQVLMQVAVGDHQVSDYAARAEARTNGASLYEPAILPGRSLDKVPFFGIPAIKAYPFAGSALVFFDSGPVRTGGLGTPPTPITNVPNALGADPHELPRRSPQGQAQKSAFLEPGGKVIQACGTGPCFSGGYTGS
jgi:hypothetical protein